LLPCIPRVGNINDFAWSRDNRHETRQAAPISGLLMVCKLRIP
jgi:hypothetical protein